MSLISEMKGQEAPPPPPPKKKKIIQKGNTWSTVTRLKNKKATTLTFNINKKLQD